MLNRYFLRLATICLPMWLTACSVAYDLQQDATLDACKKIVDWNQRTECINKNSVSYEQYEKQRQNVINKKSD
jgi:hypothetical protein